MSSFLFKEELGRFCWNFPGSSRNAKCTGKHVRCEKVNRQWFMVLTSTESNNDKKLNIIFAQDNGVITVTVELVIKVAK